MLKQWAYLRAIAHGDAGAARRVVWWELVKDRRAEAKELMERIAYYESVAESYQEVIDRGVASTGTPYNASVLNGKGRFLGWGVEEQNKKRKELAALQEIPTYREWCALVRK
jgi:hypothetical protein